MCNKLTSQKKPKLLEMKLKQEMEAQVGEDCRSGAGVGPPNAPSLLDQRQGLGISEWRVGTQTLK